MRGFDDLEAIYSTDQFIPITWYLNAPYEISAGSARFTGYGYTGTPSIMLDGVSGYVGGAAAGSMFDTYHPMYQSRATTVSPLVVEAKYVVAGTTGTVTVDVTLDENLPAGNDVAIVICRDNYHLQSYMAVEMATGGTLSIDQALETEQFVSDFYVDPAWTQEELKVVVFVQEPGFGEILQGALAVPDYKGVVNIDCEPDGVQAEWHLLGPNSLSMNGAGDASVSMFFAGEYYLSWEPIPYWDAPTGPGSQTLYEDGTITFTGTYTNGPFSMPASGDPAVDGAGRGVAMVDFDGDGDLDVHVTNEGSADVLLRNDAGVFSSVAAGPLADAGLGCSAVWHDVDGDGNLDVYIGRNGEQNLLLVGDGQGGFTAGNTFGLDETGNARTVSWVDYDRDGLLDLYVVNNGGINAMYKFHGVMNGFLVFAAVSNSSDVTGNQSGVAWNDIDGDGYMDMYLLTQYGSNLLLQNTPLGFSDVTSLANLGDTGNAMGADWGDFDNDGDFDLYLTNDGNADRLWRTNDWDAYSLVIGDNLSDEGNGRGVTWVDLDNDSFLDLYIVRNGQPDLLLFGNGDGTFDRAPVGPGETIDAGNAVACGDVNGDGKMDVYVTRDGATNLLMLNEIDTANHWFDLKLYGPDGNPLAIGTRVSITAGGVSQVRQVTGGGGWLAMNGGPVHFGLGTSDHLDALDITWPDGTVQHFTGPIGVDYVQDVIYGQTVGIADVPDDEPDVPVSQNVLGAARPNPFNPSTTISYSVERPGHVRLEVFSVDGRKVRTLVDERVSSGEHSANWQGRDDGGRLVASGTYLYRLTTSNNVVLSGRMTLVK